jgi:hypothetical protein
VVRRFIERDASNIKVVFSTYHSSRIVSDGVRGLASFDVAIFDEAHKTTDHEAALSRMPFFKKPLTSENGCFLPRHLVITIFIIAIEKVISKSNRWTTQQCMVHEPNADIWISRAAGHHSQLQGRDFGR